MSARPAATTVSRRVWKRRHRTVAAVGPCGLVVCGLHAYIQSRGPHWVSPLLAGEWIFNVVATAFLFLFCAALGRRLCASMGRLDSRSLDDGLAAVGIGFGALTTAVLVLGALHLYYRPVLLVLFAGGLIVLRSDLLYLLLQTERRVRRWRRAGCATAPETGQRVILALLGFTSLYVLLRSMLPLMDWDAIIYHVASVKLYLAYHAIIPLRDMPLANGPSSEEMLFLLGLVAGTDGLGKVLNIGFALLLTLSIYALGRRLSGPVAGWQAVLLFCSSFWMIAVLPLAIVDFASAFLLIAAVNDGAGWAERFADPGERSRRRAYLTLLRCGLLTGCAAATKLSMLAALPVAGSAVLVTALFCGNRRWSRRIGDAFRVCVLFAVGAATPVAPWLLKSWICFGNPLYPFATVAVSNPSHGITVDTTSHPPLEHATWIVTSLGDFLWNHVSVLALVLPVALITMRRPGQRFAEVFLAAGLAVWFLYVPYFDPPRYYLGLAGVAQVVSICALYSVAPHDRRVQIARTIGVFAYLLSRAWPNLLIGLGVLQQSLLGQVARGDISRYDYLAGQVRAYVAEQWVNSYTPANSVVVTVGTLTGYYLDRTYLNDWYRGRLGELQAGTAARSAEIETWCRAGLRFVVFDRSAGNPGLDGLAEVMPRQAFPWLRTPGLGARVLFSANGVDVLAVRPCAVANQRTSTR